MLFQLSLGAFKKQPKSTTLFSHFLLNKKVAAFHALSKSFNEETLMSGYFNKQFASQFSEYSSTISALLPEFISFYMSQ